MPLHLSDTEWVMLVIAGIYLFECACAVRRDALCLASVLGRFRALPSPVFMGNERKKVVLGNPSPFARCFVCEPWPVAVSAAGICLPDGLGTSGGRPIRFLAFEQMPAPITAVEKEVRAGDWAIAACSSHELARRLAEMLSEVAATPADERGKRIGAWLDRTTDNAAAAERYKELKKLAMPLRSSGLVLFFLAFVLGPVMYYLPRHIPWQSVSIYFLFSFSVWMLAVWDYSVCRKALLGESFSRRFRHVGLLFLSPAGAMRAGEVLFRDALAEFHPLAAAAALCTKERTEALARPMLLALAHPRPDERPGKLPGEPEAARVEAWFRAKLLKRLQALLRRAEIDVDELLGPPERLADSQSYCPRCRNQYVLAEGVCKDCGGLALEPYGEKPQPAETR